MVPQLIAQQVTAGGTVFQHGDATPVLCMGGLMESYPPQCSDQLQPLLQGWSWDDIDGEVSASDVKWLESVFIRGEYDAVVNTLTVIEHRSYNDEDAARFTAAFPLVDHSVPCAEPEGGWPRGRAGWPDAEVAALDGYAGAWGSAGAEGPPVMVVKFTGDLAAAQSAVEDLYPGAVCVIAADHDAHQLEQIRQAVTQAAAWKTVDVMVDVTGEWVEAVSLAPQPELQAEFDAEFGPGLVRLRSMMLPAE